MLPERKKNHEIVFGGIFAYIFEIHIKGIDSNNEAKVFTKLAYYYYWIPIFFFERQTAWTMLHGKMVTQRNRIIIEQEWNEVKLQSTRQHNRYSCVPVLSSMILVFHWWNIALLSTDFVSEIFHRIFQHRKHLLNSRVVKMVLNYSGVSQMNFNRPVDLSFQARLQHSDILW